MSRALDPHLPWLQSSSPLIVTDRIFSGLFSQEATLPQRLCLANPCFYHVLWMFFKDQAPALSALKLHQFKVFNNHPQASNSKPTSSALSLTSEPVLTFQVPQWTFSFEWTTMTSYQKQTHRLLCPAPITTNFLFQIGYPSNHLGFKIRRFPPYSVVKSCSFLYLV